MGRALTSRSSSQFYKTEKCQRQKERNFSFKSALNVIPTMRVASICRGQTYTDLLAVLLVKPLDTLTPMLTEIPVSSGPKRLSMSTLLTKKMIPGTKMVFAGLKKKADRKNLVAFLKTLQ